VPIIRGRHQPGEPPSRRVSNDWIAAGRDGSAGQNDWQRQNALALHDQSPEQLTRQTAQAYAPWVPLHDPDLAPSILPIGTRERTDSPTRISTLALWSEHKLQPARLSLGKATALGVERTVLAHEPARWRSWHGFWVAVRIDPPPRRHGTQRMQSTLARDPLARTMVLPALRILL
jgi:hypothetical protein